MLKKRRDFNPFGTEFNFYIEFRLFTCLHGNIWGENFLKSAFVSWPPRIIHPWEKLIIHPYGTWILHSRGKWMLPPLGALILQPRGTKLSLPGYTFIIHHHPCPHLVAGRGDVLRMPGPRRGPSSMPQRSQERKPKQLGRTLVLKHRAQGANRKKVTVYSHLTLLIGGSLY